MNARGNLIEVLEALPHPGTGSTVLAQDHAAIQYAGSWSVAGSFKETTDFSADLRVAFFGDEATLVLGTGPDHGICEIYIGGLYWRSIDGYAASAGEQSIVIELEGEGPHLLEVFNQQEKHLSASGCKLRFKSLTANRQYDLHTIQYGYDGISRLTDADYFLGMNEGAAAFRAYGYAYDLAGNRTEQVVAVNGTPTTTDYTYNALNQLTGDGANIYEYDDNGNLWKTNSQVTHTYDRANRLLSFGGVSYTYNGQGQRLSQTVSGVVKNYLLDVQPGLWKVIAETEGTNTTRYVHGPLGIQNQEQPNSAWVPPIVDALGSVRDVMDANLIPLETRLYSPYGKSVGVVGPNSTTLDFTGESYDG